MAHEDFTTYTEIDPAAKITLAANSIYASSGVAADSYVYKDFGENYFSGGFEHKLTVSAIAGYSGNGNILHAISNDIDDYNGIISNSKSELAINCWQTGSSPIYYNIGLIEIHNGTVYTDTYSVPSTPWTFYLTIKRDESIGAHGRLYCYIYSDLSRTILLDTLQLDLHEKIDFRYIYGFQQKHINPSWQISNLDLQIIHIEDSFSVESNLLQNISSYFSVISTLFHPNFKIISNLIKSIYSVFNIGSNLLKEYIGSFKIISNLRKAIITGFRDYENWTSLGSISVGASVDGTRIISGPTIIKKVWLHCRDTGIAGSTIIDINVNGVSVFSNPDDRPELEYNDGNKTVESLINDVKINSGDRLTMDIDQVATNSEDLSVTLVIEQFTGLYPQVDYIELLDNQFLMGREKCPYSNKFRIKIRFDQTMDSTVNPILDLISVDGQSDVTITGSGSWGSVYQPNDSYTTSEISLDEDNIGKFELIVSGAKSLFGTEMLSESINFEIIFRSLIFRELAYTENKDIEVDLNVDLAQYVRFSMDGSTWGSWLDYEKTKTIDITSSLIGGNISEEKKMLYVQFKDSAENTTDGTDFIYITYVTTALTLPNCSLTQYEYHPKFYHGETHRLKYKMPDVASLIPVKITNIYIDDEKIYTYPRNFNILSGFQIDWSIQDTKWSPPSIMPAFTLTEGTYIDEIGIKRTISAQNISLDDPINDDRIDVIYIDKDDNTIKILKGAEGRTEKTLEYGQEYTIPYSKTTFPEVPYIEEKMYVLHYVYVSLSIKYFNQDPAVWDWVIQYSILPPLSYRPFSYYNNDFIIYDFFISEGEHEVKIEIVDEIGRKASQIFEVDIKNAPKMGRLRAWTDSSKTTEIISGEAHSNSSIWLELEEYE